MVEEVTKRTNNIHGILLNPKTVLDIENLKEKTVSDELGFSGKVNDFVDYVKEYLGDNQSIVVGIYGRYGTGKSVFVNLVKENVKSSDKSAKFITFHSWKYKDEESVWRNFILVLSKELQNKEKRNDLNNSLYFTKEKIEFDMKAIRKDLLGLYLFVTACMVYLTNVFGEIKQILELMTLITTLVFMTYTYHSIKRIRRPMSHIEEFEEKLIESINDCKHEKIYIVIENIDRCLPHQSLRLLESLSSFFEPLETSRKTKCIFLIPCDKGMLEYAIKKEYDDRELNTINYLDKLIQLPYELPTPSSTYYKEYVESLLNRDYKNTKLVLDKEGVEKRYFEYITDLLKLADITNPRKIKILLREWEMRFVNLDESVKYKKETWGQSINLESALFLLKLLILKKTMPYQYSKYLNMVSIIEELIKEPTTLSEILRNMFKKGGWNEILTLLEREATGGIYKGKLNKELNNLDETSNLLSYGCIQPKSFEDLQEFLLVTKTKKEVLKSPKIKKE